MKNYCVVILLVCLSTTYALIGFGTCPAKTGVNNFDLQRFSGFWYENRALENVHLTQETWGTCQTILFDDTTRTNVSFDDSRNIFSDFLPGNSNARNNYTRQTATISTIVLSVNHTGAINADFVPSQAEFKIHGTWRFLSIPVQTIKVLDTDYTNWALLWSCTDMGNLLNKQNAWILSRSQSINSSTVSNAILTSLFSQGLYETDFRLTDQTNCRARASRKPFFSPLAFSQVKSAHNKVLDLPL